MTEEETFYLSVGQAIEGSEKSQMFGKPCFKINGKAFVCFFQNEMVFKLAGDIHKEALTLAGSKLFDPSGSNRPMKEWVQVSGNYKDKWTNFAENAMMYVSGKTQ